MVNMTRRAVLAGGATVLITGVGAAECHDEASDDSSDETRDDTASEGREISGIDGLEPEYEFEGSGQSVTDEVELDDGPTIGVFDYDGGASMTVNAIPQADQDREEPIVMTDEDARGVSGMMATAGPYVFEVEPGFVDTDVDESEIGWELAIAQPEVSEDEISQPPLEAEGDESTVLGPIELEGTEVAAATHEGEGLFEVTILPADDEFKELPFFESGEHEGEATVRSEGLAWVTVQATGAWTLTIE